MAAALEITNLCKTYHNGFEALKGVSLTVREGDFFALLGPNGAGKSTAIGIVCSLINKSAGQVRIHGHDIDHDLAAAKRRLGLVPQEFNFNVWEPVEEILLNQAGYYGIPVDVARPRTEHFLRQMGLWDKRQGMARDLSGGMKRRLMIARALVHEPRLLILDEPTAGVDIESRRSMWDFLRKINAAGTTIILTTHYLEEAESLCDKIAIIDQGQIVEDSDMKTLLNKLHQQTLILELANPLPGLPGITGFTLRQRDDLTLEVDVRRDQNLNSLFAALDTQGVTVASMRNKSNRLEELFIKLIEDGNLRHLEPTT